MAAVSTDSAPGSSATTASATAASTAIGSTGTGSSMAASSTLRGTRGGLSSRVGEGRSRGHGFDGLGRGPGCPAEQVGEFGGTGGPDGGIPGKSLLQHLPHGSRNPPDPQVGNRLGSHPGHHRLHPFLSITTKRGMPGKQREQAGSQAVDIGGNGGRPAVEHLRSGVLKGGSLRSRRPRSLLKQSVDPEVGEFGNADTGEEDVPRFEVAVQHPRPMNVVDRIGHPGDNVDRPRPRQRSPAGQMEGERTPLHELHHKVGKAAGGDPRLVDTDDAGIGGQRPEPPQTLLHKGPVVVGGGQQQLDGNVTVQPRLESAEHHPGPAVTHQGISLQPRKPRINDAAITQGACSAGRSSFPFPPARLLAGSRSSNPRAA